MTTDEVAWIPWWQAEPLRLERDRRDVASLASDLELSLEGEGRWSGHLPRWAFDRPEPPGLSDLIGDTGLCVEVQYHGAYPMLPPSVFPKDPEPSYDEWTLHTWHVLGDGSLCLFQSWTDWEPDASIGEVLLKAAGWRVEYALLKAGVIEQMSERGIASDDTYDHLVAEAAGKPVPADEAES